MEQEIETTEETIPTPQENMERFEAEAQEMIEEPVESTNEVQDEESI